MAPARASGRSERIRVVLFMVIGSELKIADSYVRPLRRGKRRGVIVYVIQLLMVLSGGSCPRRTLYQRVVHQDGKAANETRPRDTLKFVHRFWLRLRCLVVLFSGLIVFASDYPA